VDDEESDLIKALLRGDEEAPRAFLQRYSRLAYAILLREFWLSRSEADDCFQTTLERLVEDNYGRIRLWRNQGPFHSYFAQTLRNVALNFLRQRRGTDAREERHDMGDLEFFHPDPNPGPERRTLLAEVRTLLDTCLQKLADRAAHVFRLRYIDEKSYRDIAHDEGIGIGHVGMILTRAEREVRDCLTRRMGESPSGILL